jgi:hypothetical protein
MTFLLRHLKRLIFDSVIYWNMFCFNIVYIYCLRARHLYTWQHWMATKMWQWCYWRQEPHCPQWPQITNLFKINIFGFSSITRLNQDLTRRVWYSILFILDDIPPSSLEAINIWLSYLHWGFNYLCGHCVCFNIVLYLLS